MQFAPILVTVYNRVLHFKNCIESLKKNIYADQTHLFIAIDYPKNESDREANLKIKEYCDNISGFKDVTLYIRDRNYGARKNGLIAKNEILSYYDSIIISEDDNIFSKYFLKFINQNLITYKENDEILAICGYQFPKVENRSNSNIIMLQGFSPWGYGIWKDRVGKIEYKINDFYTIFLNKQFYKEFIKEMGGKYFTSLLISNIKDEIYGDIYVNYAIFAKKLKCIFPSRTLVLNKGQDGSGLHSGKNSYFEKQFIDESFDPSGDAIYDPRCQKLFVKEMKYPLYKEVYYYLLYRSISRIKNI